MEELALSAPLFIINKAWKAVDGLCECHVEGIMEDNIQKLYHQVRDIGAWYMIYQIHDNIERTKKIIPEIQEFVLWFLEENRFGIENELYQGMSCNLIDILKDILGALEQDDMVLLNDAMSYGLMEYLQLFLDVGQEVEIEENV